MALVNPNIAMSFRGVEMPQQNALADYAAIQQIQGGQRQAEVAQMQLESLRRDQAALSKMQEAITAKGGPADLNVAADEMIKSGIPEYFKQGLTIKQTLDKQKRFASLLGPTGGAAPAAVAPANEPYPGYNESIGMTPSVNAMAPAAAAPVNAMADRINQAYAIGTPEALAWAKAREEELKPMTVGSSSSVYNPQTKTFTQAPAAPVAPAAPPSMVGEFNFAKTPAGGNFTGTFQQFVTARAAAGRAPAQPTAPVAVVDPTTGKSVFVSREQAISGKMAPAAAQESLPPKEIQKREAALPQATSAVTGFEKKTDSFVKDLTALRNHPGLSEITGFAAGRLPGITADGRAAQALYDKVVAKGGFQALQDLRDASKTGGALGNVSNQEGKQLTASFSAIDRRQDVTDVQSALDTAIADVQGARTRMREAYDMTYAYKSGEAPTPRSPGAAPAATAAALSPAEQTELDQLRKRFGGK